MTFSWTPEWTTAEKAAKTRTRRVKKRLCGIPYYGTHSKHFPYRKYDTRDGDTIPARVSKYSRKLVAEPTLLRVFLYPGADPETPDFHHIKSLALGQSPIWHDRQTLMVSLMIEGGPMIELPSERLTTHFDKTITCPKLRVSCYQEGGFMVYDGLKDFSAAITFRDEDQRAEYTTELNQADEIPTIAVA